MMTSSDGDPMTAYRSIASAGRRTRVTPGFPAQPTGDLLMPTSLFNGILGVRISF
jgi:hypothetical protein